MRSQIETSLQAAYPSNVVAELLNAYEEVRHKYQLGGLRLAEVEGGRFCEAAFRLLEIELGRAITPLGESLRTEKLVRDLQNTPGGSLPDSVRLHIPRCLRMVYDIRNKRAAAHLADGIDPNFQDATLVLAATSWVLAEFLRLHHSVSADEAQNIVQQLVTRQTPVVQDFDGFLKVLDPDISAGDHCLVVLYQTGHRGASFDELEAWARPKMRQNLRRTLHRQEHDYARIHSDGERYRITLAGESHVEGAGLLD